MVEQIVLLLKKSLPTFLMQHMYVMYMNVMYVLKHVFNVIKSICK